MILIGTDEGIYRWFDGLGWPVFHGLQERPVVGLASPGPGVLVALERSGAVLESLNNGMDWRTLPLAAGVDRPTALAVSRETDTILIGVRPLALYRRHVGAPTPRAGAVADTATGRAAWVGRARALAGTASAMVAPGRVRPAADPEAVRLAGWLPLNPPPAPRTTVSSEVRSIIPVGDGHATLLATVNNAGLWRSEDLGAAWTQCPGLPSEVFSVRHVPGKPSELWAGTADGAWFSSDAGKSWEDRGAGLENARQVRALDVHPTNPKHLLAGAAPVPTGSASPAGGLDYALYETTDAGQTWAKVLKRNFPESLGYDTVSDIRFDPEAPENVMAAFGSGELWVTRNGGAYWGPLARQIKAARVLCTVG